MMAKNKVETNTVCCYKFVKISWQVKKRERSPYWFEVVYLRCSSDSAPDNESKKDKF